MKRGIVEAGILLTVWLGGWLAAGTAAAAVDLSEIPDSALPTVLETISSDRKALHVQRVKETDSGRGVYKADLPGKALDYRFSGDGVRIESRHAEPVGLRLRAYGFNGVLQPVVQGAEPVVSKARIEYHYAGLSEWFINTPLGLEHGFTLQAPTNGTPESAAIEIGYSGELSLRLMPDGRGVQLVDDQGLPVYRYSGLAAWDADGDKLDVQMRLADAGLELHVDLQDARFPVTIDPLFETETRLTASDGNTGNQFGFSVDVDGQWMAVGAPYAEDGAATGAGAVYMFRRTGSQWTQFVPNSGDGILRGDSVANARFGWDVALQQSSVSGNPMLLVGARDEDGVTADMGAAYVYEFGLFCYSSQLQPPEYECWDRQARLVGSGVGNLDYFGHSVAIDYNTLVVGAQNDEGPLPAGSDTGAVYVFNCDTLQFKLAGSGPNGDTACSNWVEEAQLYQPSTLFGNDVAIDGDLIAAGAPYDSAAGGQAGAVFTYRLLPAGDSGAPDYLPAYNVVFEQKITAGTAAGDRMGHAVAVAGNELVAGAPKASNGTVNSGVARVYSWNASTWNLDITLTPLQADNVTPDGAFSDNFGNAVDIELGGYPGRPDYILVGAPGNDDAGTRSGSAYLYQRSSGGWAQISKITASDAASTAEFGHAVALDTGSLAVGARGDDGQASDAGAAYVYTTPLTTSLDLVMSTRTVTAGTGSGSSATATVTLRIPGVSAPNSFLAGRTVTLDTVDPLGATQSIAGTTDNEGKATINRSYTVPGTWKVRATYPGESALDLNPTNTLDQDLVSNAHAGYAVVIEGGRFVSGSPAQQSTEKSASRIIQYLLARGLTGDRIFHFGQDLNPAPDALATNSNLNSLLLSNDPLDGIDSLLEKIQLTPAPLHIFLVGQAVQGGRFFLNPTGGANGTPEILSATQLDVILDQLEQVAGQQAQPRNLVVATPYSGGFLPILTSDTPPGRIVVASTTAAGPAFKGPVEILDGIAPASFFLDELLARLAEGFSLQGAFNLAGKQVARLTRASDSNLIAAGQFVDNSLQKPAMADPSGRAVTTFLGVGDFAADDFTVADTLFLPPIASTASVTVSDQSAVPSRGWSIAVRNPGTLLNATAGDEQLDLPYATLAMTQSTQNPTDWSAAFPTPVSGKYDVWYWGEDNTLGRETVSRLAHVYVDQLGNNPPSLPTILYPADGETNVAPSFEAAWTDSVDPDGDAVTYRLVISNKNVSTNGELDAANVIFSVDELDFTRKTFGFDAGMVYGGEYFWQVIAVDRWGTKAAGGISRALTAAPDTDKTVTAYFGGNVTTAGAAVQAIEGADVVWLSSSTLEKTASSGDYVFSNYSSPAVNGIIEGPGSPCGTLIRYQGTLSASATDHVSAQVAMDFCEGAWSLPDPNDLADPNAPPWPGNFSLTPSGAPVDTDGDGLADTLEQQIGTDPGVGDTDGDGINDFDEVNWDGDPNVYTDGLDLNPFETDSDLDGVNDRVERDTGHDPLDPSDRPVWGDTNGDGTVDGADVLLVTRFVLGLATATTAEKARSDIAPLVGNVPPILPNNKIEVDDLLLIQRKALGLAAF